MLPKKSKNNTTILNLKRHAEKKGISGKITEKGRINSKNHGKQLNPKIKLKIYSSPEERAIETAKEIIFGFKGNKVYHKILLRKELNENEVFFFLKRFFDNLKNIAGEKENINGVVKLWLNNKIPTKLMLSPQETADIFIRKRIGHVIRYLRMINITTKTTKVPKTRIEAITHAGIIMPTYERLTGIKYFDKFKRLPNSETSMLFLFSPIGNGKVKIIIKFYKQKYDVTEKVYEILNKK